jgi:hypothetical protein
LSLHGSCHCGNLRFELDWAPPEPTDIPARACGCSFCLKHGGVWTSSPNGALRVAVQDATLHARYRFGTGTADFHVCRRCGAVPVVTSTIDARLYAVVNVNCFDDVDRTRLRPQPVSFETEDTAGRLARRARGWIGQVRFDGAAP